MGGGAIAGRRISPLPQHIENSGRELLLPGVVERSMSQCKAPHSTQVWSIRPRLCMSEGSRYGRLVIGKLVALPVCGGAGPMVWVCGGVGKSGRGA